MLSLCTKRLGCAAVDVDAEERRVGKSSPARLQLETAATWVARAAAFARLAASHEKAGRTAKAAQAAAQRDDALHEALEHAALADSTGRAVSRVRPAFRAARRRKRTGR
jgi:hypothetical protein